MPEPSARSVVRAEPVHPRLDVVVRPHRAVDQRHVPEELGLPWVRVEQGLLSAGGARQERLVLDHERHLELAAGQTQGALDLVADQVAAREPCVDVQPRDAERVIVIPERRGLLVVEPVVGVRLTRQERVVGRAVGARGHVVAVHVHGGARRRGVVPSVVGPVQRGVDPERVRAELVARDVGHGLTALRDHDRPEVGDRGIRRISEGRRLAEIAVEPVRSRSHRQPARGQLRRRDDGRDRQRIDERSHRSRRDRLRFILGRGHRAGPSVRNQQRATRGDTAR